MNTSLINQFEFLCKENQGSKLEQVIVNLLESEIVNIDHLVDSKNVKDLGEGNKFFQTMVLFSRGDYRDYKEKKSQYIELTDKMLSKLRILTIREIASEVKVIEYPYLLNTLDIEDKFDLDSLLFKAITMNILKAKIDHKAGLVKVLSVSPRDNIKDMKSARAKIQSWIERIENSEKFLSDEVTQMKDTSQALNSKVEKKLEEIQNLRTIKKTI